MIWQMTDALKPVSLSARRQSHYLPDESHYLSDTTINNMGLYCSQNLRSAKIQFLFSLCDWFPRVR